MNKEWFENTADDLTDIFAAIMHIKPSHANRVVNAVVAKLGGVGTAAGVYGVASLVGTAGTGTAISTLSGAALNSATLAWLGGSVFTGTIVLFGIAAIGGWSVMRLWTGKPRKYEELTEKEQNIANACVNLSKAFKEQSISGNTIDKAVMDVVIQEGLLPLKVSLEEYLQIKQYKHIVTEGLSVSGRAKLFLKIRKLETRILEINQWKTEHKDKEPIKNTSGRNSDISEVDWWFGRGDIGNIVFDKSIQEGNQYVLLYVLNKNNVLKYVADEVRPMLRREANAEKIEILRRKYKSWRKIHSSMLRNLHTKSVTHLRS